MCAFALFLCVDPSLGRVGYSLFSDQTLMEMLIDGFDHETKKTYIDKDGMYLDVCKWSRIKCDDNERVIQIHIVSSIVSGSLELRYVPPKVKLLSVRWWLVSQLTGSLDLAHLPGAMEDVRLGNNKLTGELDLAHIPDGVKYLFLNNNQFSGEIDLTHLPNRMNWLFLQSNQLTGKIDLAHLPEGMESLCLNSNQLTGSLIIGKLPQGINMIDVRRNHFNAIAVVNSETKAAILLCGSGVTSVVDENGKADMRWFL